MWKTWVNRGELVALDKLDDRILLAPNPYANLKFENTLPKETELLRASSILALLPEVAKRDHAADIARAEFEHYVAQTYYFEALGIQILSAIVTRADSFDLLHHIGAQIIDETRHAQLYCMLTRAIGDPVPVPDAIPNILSRMLSAKSLEEQMIRTFVVLESLAVGIFTARARAYGENDLTKVDRLLLKEEASHQLDGIRFLSESLAAKKMSYESMLAIIRQDNRDLTDSLLPTAVVRKFDLPLLEKDYPKLKSVGLLAQQIQFTSHRLRWAMTALKRAAEGIRE